MRPTNLYLLTWECPTGIFRATSHGPLSPNISTIHLPKHPWCWLGLTHSNTQLSNVRMGCTQPNFQVMSYSIISLTIFPSCRGLFWFVNFPYFRTCIGASTRVMIIPGKPHAWIEMTSYCQVISMLAHLVCVRGYFTENVLQLAKYLLTCFHPLHKLPR